MLLTTCLDNYKAIGGIMKTLQNVINDAKAIKQFYKKDFVTVWLTKWPSGNCYGFNFDRKPIGHIRTEYNISSEVIGIY